MYAQTSFEFHKDTTEKSETHLVAQFSFVLCCELSLPDPVHRPLLFRLQLLHQLVSEFTILPLSLHSLMLIYLIPASFRGAAAALSALIQVGSAFC